MYKTRNQHVSTEDREFKLLLRRDAVTGALSVAASSTGAWASSISLGVSDEGMPCCTAVISPAPDMLETAAGALVPEEERECIEAEAIEQLEEPPIEQAAEDEPDVAASAAEQEPTAKPEPEAEEPKLDAKPAEQLEGRPFEEIAKGAAKKASDAKSSGGKQAAKPFSSGRQSSRTFTGGTQAAGRR